MNQQQLNGKNKVRTSALHWAASEKKEFAYK